MTEVEEEATPEAAVKFCYNAVLRRQPTTPELDYFVHQISLGMSHLGLVEVLWSSEEFRNFSGVSLFVPPGRYPYLFSISHHTQGPVGATSIIETVPELSEDGLSRARRLLRSYEVTKSNLGHGRAAEKDDLWTGLIVGQLQPMVDALESGSEEIVADFLRLFGGEYMWFGGISTGRDGLNHWDLNETQIAHTYIDQLVSFAEALDCLPVENPSLGLRGRWGQNIAYDADYLVGLVENKLGIRLLPPFGSMTVAGIPTAGGPLHYRHVNACYAAARIRDIVEKPTAVCEYGGGMGLVAYYLWQFGFRDITLLDIPLTNILSANFLMDALGPENVSLEGEAARPDQVKIRSSALASRWTEGRTYGISVNQDSFPEIAMPIVEGFFDVIARTTEGYFFSINQEGQTKIQDDIDHLDVPRILEPRAHKYRRLFRYPNWIRRGYVDELYEIVR